MAWSTRSASILFLLGLATALPALAASTARQALKDVVAQAQKWRADAVLTHVSTLSGQSDGRAASWLYTFYSPSAKKSAIVTARDARIDIEPDVRNTSVDALAADFIDSDKAADAAAQGGLKADKSSKDLGFGLTVANQAVGRPQLMWSVTVMTDSAMTSVQLDGRSGSFIRRNQQSFK